MAQNYNQRFTAVGARLILSLYPSDEAVRQHRRARFAAEYRSRWGREPAIAPQWLIDRLRNEGVDVARYIPEHPSPLLR